ncbi:rhomboid family intramembrane serine protease [Plectonema radiosum NIES-515]|uniref:Rhomboid family intramembrane serine protease n=1 Tax=Plectonema radiosum NIES-515 TaxID=2986073 RepID=A0ABT3B4C3_9CYAN|nr:rhomboid family intramembrane serine protease [Plectonema radiosum]MCV3216224.1 rhomboid family intramembrane serine protease [Plectonema radiosum NIES-515]
MIPISDNIYTRTKPIVNSWLIGINMALFLWELKLELTGELGSFINNWGVIPAQISEATMQALTGNPAAWIVVVLRSTSLLLSMFIHGSFSQILGNLIFLWVFGKTVENIFGARRYLAFYLASGILTGVIEIIAEPSLSVSLIGANGAIASVLGAYLVKFSKAKIYSVLPLLIVYIPVQIPAIFYLFWWFAQQLFYGIGSLNISTSINQPSFAYWVHGAGFLIGAAYMRILQRR